MSNELVIYTDESDKKGEYCSNFYGGVLVRSQDLSFVIEKLEKCKQEQNMFNEIKWGKVTEAYLEKYIAVMDAFFDIIAADKAKVRIMFTSNQYVPKNLSREQRKNEYHLLYYQFIKHAFGLRHCLKEMNPPVHIRLNIDQMPSSREEVVRFKSYLEGLNFNAQHGRVGIRFDKEQIAEIDSGNHVLLQCLDVVLGAMQFRLNNKHKIKPPGKNQRGKKTIAKEKLYKYISSRVREIYPNFNIGITTGKNSGLADLWKHPYRHWVFVSKEYEIDKTKAKP